MPLLLILFIGVPIAEIALFIQAGELIGLWWTIATVVVTAFIGTALVRQQGIAVLSRAQSALQENRMPLEEVFTGICLLLAGALLLTPGFLTDALGFCLLIPPLRAIIGLGFWKLVKDRGTFQMHMGNAGGQGTHGHPNPGHGPFKPGSPDDIIDGDFEVVNPDDETKPRQNKRIPPEKPRE